MTSQGEYEYITIPRSCLYIDIFVYVVYFWDKKQNTREHFDGGHIDQFAFNAFYHYLRNKDFRTAYIYDVGVKDLGNCK